MTLRVTEGRSLYCAPWQDSRPDGGGCEMAVGKPDGGGCEIVVGKPDSGRCETVVGKQKT